MNRSGMVVRAPARKRVLAVALLIVGLSVAGAGGSGCDDPFHAAVAEGGDAGTPPEQDGGGHGPEREGGSDVAAPIPSAGCALGTTIDCFCPGSERGRQDCGADGTFGPCACPDSGAADGGLIPCGAGSCNPTTQLCVQDPASKLESCATKCQTNSDCGSEGCCVLLQSNHVFNGQFACIGARVNGGYCRCSTRDDCGPGGECTPHPSRGTYYTCQPNDGPPYRGCAYNVGCVGYHDCVGDCRNNYYCAPADATLSNCPEGSGFCITGRLGPAARAPCYNSAASGYDCDRDCMLCSCRP